MSTTDPITVQFTKATGAGNDFVVVDNMAKELELDWSRFAAAVCNRHFGVGGDGLLVVEPSSKADFHMKYYNSDGSYGGMCGNGGRCISRFALEQGICSAEASFEALGHIYRVSVSGDSAILTMKNPVDFRHGLLLEVNGKPVAVSFLNTGSPHAVVEVSSLESYDVQGDGRILRHHKEFQPDGANVNFFTYVNPSCVILRTYERGVEAETLACGTGSVATALIAAHRYSMASPVEVRVQSGESLRVHFEESPEKARNVRLEGGARLLFSGTLRYDPHLATIAS